MNLQGPILVIEDDQDDQQILRLVFQELQYPNEILFFDDGEIAFKYLSTTAKEPFLIFSDINMPKLNGLQLRAKIVADLSVHLLTPFLFLTTSNNEGNVLEAYAKCAQGYFLKPNSYSEIKEMIRSIIDYWQKCVLPNSLCEL